MPPSETPDFSTRNDAKVCENTWEYAKCVDGINTLDLRLARPVVPRERVMASPIDDTTTSRSADQVAVLALRTVATTRVIGNTPRGIAACAVRDTSR
jgi:hypothetical protein